MIRSNFLILFVSSACAALWVTLAGCSGHRPVDSTLAQESPKTETADSRSPQATAQPPELLGVWYGESVYDVDAFNEKLSEVSQQEAQDLQDLVGVFATIIMAAEFRGDSVVELDMMITANDGTQLRDRSVGTWNIVERSATRLKVETSEYKNANQQPNKQVYVYQFIDEDHFQFVPESISPDLLGFSPRIVFQRVEQPLADPAVAQQPGDTLVR